MYEVIYTGQFKKSLKQCVRRGLDVNIFKTVLDIPIHVSRWVTSGDWSQDNEGMTITIP